MTVAELFSPEFIKYLMSLGVGGIIAGLMFAFYRKDVKMYTDQWKGQSEQLTQVVKENTKAITENTQITQLVYEHLQYSARGDDGHPLALPDRRRRATS